jgi:hypothetical protein
VIDRYCLARHVIWLRNHLAPPGHTPPWPVCAATGSVPERPAWLATIVLIACDNTIHVLINSAALLWLR